MTLEDRIRRIEDEQEIGQLRARYCHLLDDRQWDDFIALFTEDGLFSGLETVQGRPALRAFFEHFAATTSEYYHFCTNGTVTVAGDRATGRITMEYLSAVNGTSYVSAGHYDDVMLRVDGRWLFQSRTITFYYLAPLAEGWAGRPFPGRARG